MNTKTIPLNRLLILFFIILMGLSACNDTGLDQATSSDIDTDGDGLSDKEELTLGTSPIQADTDGDGFTDGKEVIDFGFNPKNNNFKFNPLIADVPNIQIEFASLPSLGLDMTTSTGSETSHAVDRSTSSLETVGRSRTDSLSVSIEASVSLLDFGVSETLTYEESMTWSSEQTSENSTAYSDAVNNAEGEELSGGSVSIAVDVRNEGHLAFTVSNLVLNANIINPKNQKILDPLGNLVFDSVNVWNDFPVAPNGQAGPFVFSNGNLSVAQIQTLLRDSSGLSVKVAAYDITDAKNNSYTHDLTEIGAKTAAVTIDYGPDNSRGVRSYLVATNGDADLLEISAEAIFNDILHLPYEQDSFGLININGVEADRQQVEKWMIVHSYINGEDREVDIYDPEIGYDFNSIILQSGHTLHLMRAADTDQDGLGLREELLFGTDPTLADSDGDTLSDGDEVKQGWENAFNNTAVFSSPVRKDTDNDGVNDNIEKDNKSNPNLTDTDGDGQPDSTDANPTVPAVLPSTWNSVAGGYHHALGLKQDGTIWAWGSNSSGQLGLGSYTSHKKPAQVGSRDDWAKVFACHYSSFAIDNDGALYAWGSNLFGRLGLNDTTQRNEPVQVGSDTDWDKLSCSTFHTVALRDDGSLWSWGRNFKGALGLGDWDDRFAPVQVGTDYDWYDISATAFTTLLMKKPDSDNRGYIYVMGTANYGELADMSGTWLTPLATSAYGLELASSEFSSFHINANGSLYSTGSNDFGNLGLGHYDTQFGWNQVSGNNYARVEASLVTTLALVMAPGETTGSLFGMGRLYFTDSNTNVPVLIGSSTSWRDISVGYGFNFALDDDDYLWAWGTNTNGQTGVDSNDGLITNMTLVY